MRFLFFALVPLFLFSQTDSLKKHILSIETSAMLTINSVSLKKFYQGTAVEFAYKKRIFRDNYVGLSSGLFYYSNKEENVSADKMNYIFVPFYLTYSTKLKSIRVNYKLGTSILSYFDSDYILDQKIEGSYKKGLINRTKLFFPTYEYADNFENQLRKKQRLILAANLQFNIYKKLFISPGLTFYIGKSYFFSYLNLALAYQLN